MSIEFERQFRLCMDDIHFSNEDKEHLRRKLSKTEELLEERKVVPMKKITFIKVATVAMVSILITGITAVAASKICSLNISSNSDYDYNTVDEVMSAQTEVFGNEDEEIQVLPTEFLNEYEFVGGNKVQVKGTDGNNVIDTWDDVSVEYKNDTGKIIGINMTIHSHDECEYDATEERIIDGTTVRYDNDEYLFVPENYDVDESIRERLEKEDHFHVSYGSEEQETKYFDSVSFIKDGITYSIDSFDGVDREDLFSIAAEILGN